MFVYCSILLVSFSLALCLYFSLSFSLSLVLSFFVCFFLWVFSLFLSSVSVNLYLFPSISMFTSLIYIFLHYSKHRFFLYLDPLSLSLIFFLYLTIYLSICLSLSGLLSLSFSPLSLSNFLSLSLSLSISDFYRITSAHPHIKFKNFSHL